jgi:hypothetical protein
VPPHIHAAYCERRQVCKVFHKGCSRAKDKNARLRVAFVILVFMHANRFIVPARPGNGLLILVVLIAVAIGLYMMFGSSGGQKSYMETVKDTKDRGVEMARQISTDQMNTLISMYRESNKKLPKEPAELDSPGAFNDPWGKEMTFTFGEKAGRTTVTYQSAGPDGQFKSEDDVKYESTLPY